MGKRGVRITDYPIDPRPRWGHGLPSHPELTRTIEQGRDAYATLLDSFADIREVLHAIPREPSAALAGTPYWNNIWFSALDAVALVGLLLRREPARYVEIGGGHSTMFARHAVEVGSLSTAIVSLDPEPRMEIDALCDEVIRAPLESSDLSMFERLAPGDVLFFDGSHRVLTNSDVTVFFLEVLPRLEPGVLVHVHDIFLPWDYPPSWSNHFYSEQYLLASMLLIGHRDFTITLPNFYVCQDAELGEIVRSLFEAPAGTLGIPFLYPGVPGDVTGVSFWLESTNGRRRDP